MEKRKVINMGGGEYQLLKPKTNDNHPCYHDFGEKKSIKAIVYMIDNKVFDLELSEGIQSEIRNYRENLVKKKQRYFQKNGLENNLKN
ncbi:hypothetical protein M0R19_00500 [Candidatus Pacearchaeota archaeon]|nr:hypothetical protein [Candidatus Pacearchaeota archaeon]